MCKIVYILFLFVYVAFAAEMSSLLGFQGACSTEYFNLNCPKTYNSLNLINPVISLNCLGNQEASISNSSCKAHVVQHPFKTCLSTANRLCKDSLVHPGAQSSGFKWKSELEPFQSAIECLNSNLDKFSLSDSSCLHWIQNTTRFKCQNFTESLCKSSNLTQQLDCLVSASKISLTQSPCWSRMTEFPVDIGRFPDEIELELHEYFYGLSSGPEISSPKESTEVLYTPSNARLGVQIGVPVGLAAVIGGIILYRRKKRRTHMILPRDEPTRNANNAVELEEPSASNNKAH